MFEMIPKDRLSAVKIAIQMTLGDTALREAIQLACGSSSLIIKLAGPDNKRYILRVMDLSDDLLNRKNQIKCLHKAIEFDLSPRCLYANAEDGITMMEFIPSIPVVITPNWLNETADSLRKLHADYSFPAPHQPLFQYMNDLEDSLIKKGVSTFIINYFKKIRDVRSILLPHLSYASSHNDLNFTNLLFDGKRTYFIDWEAAGIEDPFFDIATICNEFIEDEKNISCFLGNYFSGTPNSYQRAKTLLMRQIAYCYSAAHFLDFSVSTGLDLSQINRVTNVPTMLEWKHGYYSTKQYHLNTGDDFLFHAMIKLNASISLMETDDFMMALQQFSSSQHDDGSGA
ncbi:MAG: phosphotransferase [Legionellaceae bacterium]|nr:phosphotransferase [Legionellaceae bacterium]